MNETSKIRFLGSLRFKYGLGLLAFLVIAIVLLWEEHQAHILGYLPLTLLLGACVGMHFFMHGAHNHSHHNDAPRDQRD